jgi:hypothetical protein
MNHSKLTLAIAVALTASVSSSAFAIDLYMDSKTKQIFAEPGKGRIKLGTFEEVKEVKQDVEKEVSKTVADEKMELASIRQDLELKENAIKALEEKAVENKENRAKNDEKWFNKINLRGYTQMRYNLGLTGDRTNKTSTKNSPEPHPELRSVGDSSIKDNSGFSLRRVRLVFSGDINDYVSMYIQPDFATTNGDLHFAQLRDAYFDLAYDKEHEYRIRAGQSKIPFGWENLQSSQNRLTLDRADALNSAVPSERDLGLMAYWSPTHVQKLWKNLSKKGLKTSGDYGVVGAGVYNGQGINKPETNDDLYVVAHTTYPFQLDSLGSWFNGQVLEMGIDGISGRYTPTTSAYTPYERYNARGVIVAKGNTTQVAAPTVRGDGNGLISEDRVAIHAVLFPQPFGLQAEWNWGHGGALNPMTNVIERQPLQGGYVQAMYKWDNVFGTQGTMIPYIKWQTYEGPWKGVTNSPYVSVDETEAGLEYQFSKALELTLAYSHMNRTNTNTAQGFLGQAQGDLLRGQLQVNY